MSDEQPEDERELFTEDELLSMGHSRLLASVLIRDFLNDEDFDRSIYLSTWERADTGTPTRALALYDVLQNDLGIFYPWPGVVLNKSVE